MRSNLRINIVLGLLILCGYQAKSQFSVDTSNPNPVDIIRESLIGEGVEILSITYDGGEESIGSFNDGKNTGGHPNGLGVENGMLMTTGAAEQVASTRVGNGEQQYDLKYKVGNSANAASQSNLRQLAGAEAILQDYAVIKIEFIPETDTFRLNYVWASEEYPNFVCSKFNDVFGFIISGPGISGAYNGGNGKNIAIIPGTNLPVTINNLNNGQYLDFDTVDPANCASEALARETAQYYINNLAYGTEARPAFNGYTTVLEAKAAVIPCETYTIELMVADINDERQDSGVFFEKGSFRTNTMDVVITTPNNDNTIAEGCETASVEINANNQFSASVPLNADIKGSATLGVDYTLKLNGSAITSPSNLTLPAGESSMNIEIEAIADAETEGTEYIVITYRKSLFINPAAICTEMDSITIFIKDNNLKAKSLPDTLYICGSGSKELDGSVTTDIAEGMKYENTSATALEPENNEIISTISVAGEQQNAVGQNAYPVICINVTHRNPKDLNIYLESPNGQILELATGVGKDFEKDYTQTCFSATATTSINDGISPFTGTFLPEGNFSDLIGATINGDWKLKITDVQTGITGTLDSWSIEFTNPYKVNYTWTPNQNITSTSSPIVQVNPSVSTLYTIKIEDIYKCAIEDSTYISVAEGYPLTVDTIQVNCFGSNTGAIVLNSTDNSVNFTWSDGTTGPQRNNLTAGEYRVTLVGDSGCEQEEVYTIRQPDELVYTSDIKGSSCAGTSDGRVTIAPSGGTGPYNITWNEVSSTSLTIDGVAAGTYTATLVDANGCETIVNAVVEERAPYSVQESKTDVSCFGAGDGKIEVTVSDNASPITYTWMGPNGFTSSESNIGSLTAGEYSVEIQEQDGCKSTRSFTISEPEKISISFDKTDVQCHGDKSGVIMISNNGGTAPYEYSIDNGASYLSTPSFGDLSAGNYAIKVKDANGCTSTDDTQVTIVQPDAVTITMDSLFNIVYGESVTLSAMPSIGMDDINSISWNPEDNLSCADCLETVAKPEVSTVYTLTITDNNQCNVSKTATVRVDRSPRVEMPNVFSPNGDRTNDEIGLVTDEVIVQEIEEFLIYDRWGSLVFEVKNAKPNSQELKWDGKTRNKNIESGVYVWVARIVLLDNVKKVYSGDITVIK